MSNIRHDLRCTAVVKIDPLSYKIIEEYSSIYEAGKMNNTAPTNVLRCCSESDSLCVGHLWRYKTDISLEDLECSIYSIKSDRVLRLPPAQICNLYENGHSVSGIVQITGYTRAGVIRLLRRCGLIAGYESTGRPPVPVYSVDPINLTKIKRYPSMKAAAIAVGVNQTAMHRAVKKGNTLLGYLWVRDKQKI